MKNIEASVGAVPTQVDEVKKYILDVSIKKIDNILKMKSEIRKINVEFFGWLAELPILPKNSREHEQNAKKIYAFQRDMWRRWEEISVLNMEIFRTIDVLYELSKIRKKYIGLKELEQNSWTEIRQEIQEKMKKTLYR